MIVTIMSLALAGAVAPQQYCVKLADNSGAAKGASWFVKGDPITYKGKKYVKYGLERQIPVDAIEQTGTHSYTAVFTEKGVKDAEVLYLLADLPACSFQPYMLDAG